MPSRNRAALIGAAVIGVVVLAAAAFGIVYLVAFAGSAPQKLTLSAATAYPTPSASSSPAAATPGTWTVAAGSQAGYRVREQLASLPAPSDAVGRTSSITGTVTISGSGSSDSVSAASITVDVSTLTSDRAIRDLRIHRQGLESDRYPTATFVLSSPIALPAEAASGQAVSVSATGALTIHGVTRTVTIPIQARLTRSQVEIAGSITFPFSDFGMTPPSIGGFVTVQNDATMEFDIKLTPQGA